MARFSDFVAAIERISVDAVVLRERTKIVDDDRPLVPVVRSTIERAAEELLARIALETPLSQPSDVIAEEWAAREMVDVREAVATLELVAMDRPSDLRRWIPDVLLAIESFERARLKFREAMEV